MFLFTEALPLPIRKNKTAFNANPTNEIGVITVGPTITDLLLVPNPLQQVLGPMHRPSILR